MAELRLTAEDRATLERWTTRRKTAHGLAVRAEIVLRCSDGCSNSQVARELRLTNTTVGKWRSRFVAGGVAALLDEPRSGAPRRISDDQVKLGAFKTQELGYGMPSFSRRDIDSLKKQFPQLIVAVNRLQRGCALG